jgi:hypothetical protein
MVFVQVALKPPITLLFYYFLLNSLLISMELKLRRNSTEIFLKLRSSSSFTNQNINLLACNSMFSPCTCSPNFSKSRPQASKPSHTADVGMRTITLYKTYRENWSSIVKGLT